MSASTIGMSARVTPIALGLMGLGMTCLLLSFWTNPVVLGRIVQAPAAHMVYFFLGVAVIFLSNRVMTLERRLSSLEEQGAASDPC